MKYSNPKIPEGINNSRENLLKEFAILSAGVVLIVLIVVFLLGWMAQWAAPHVPFAFEKKLADRFFAQTETRLGNRDVQSWMQGLADQLAADEGLPAGVSVTIHYSDEDTVNAFATLGGHILMYRGLLERLNSENAVAMVLAHEIAHIKHRDPIIAAGRGVAIILALAAVSGSVGDQLADRVMGNTAILASFSFSREQERAADRSGLQAVYDVYGHVAGATDLFKTLLKAESGGAHTPEFMQTHPGSEGRIQAIGELARKNDWPVTGDVKPLPDFISTQKQ